MKFLRVFFTFSFCFAMLVFSPLAVPQALAQNEETQHIALTDRDILGFLQSADELEDLAVEIRENSGIALFKVDPAKISNRNAPTHVRNVAAIKSGHADFYGRLSEKITNFNYKGEVVYTSAEAWAELADRIMVTSMVADSSKEEQNLRNIQDKFAPLVEMSKMHPQAAKQMEGLLAMIRTLTNVSDADREVIQKHRDCLLYTSPSPRDQRGSRMPSSA